MKNILFDQRYAGVIVATSFLILLFTFLLVVQPWLALGIGIAGALVILNKTSKRHRAEQAALAERRQTWGY